MFRNGNKEAPMPSAEGINIPGVGVVSAPVDNRGWIRRHANGLRIAANGAAAAGLIAVQGAVTAKTGGFIEALGESYLFGTAMSGLTIDAIDRWLRRTEQDTNPYANLPTGTELSGKEIIAAPRKSGIGTTTTRVIYSSSQLLGNPTLIFLTAKLAEAGNVRDAVITGAAEIVLLSNLPRNRKMVRSLEQNQE